MERKVKNFFIFPFKNCHIAISTSNLSDYKVVMGMAILYFWVLSAIYCHKNGDF